MFSLATDWPLALGLAALLAAVLAALATDACLGEPPTALHPVVWIGRYLGTVGRWVAPLTPPRPGDAVPPPLHLPPAWAVRHYLLGVLAWCLGAAGVFGLALALQQALLALPSPALAVLLLGLALKPLLAWALLRDEVAAVEAALGRSLGAGRERLAWLVSRDTTALSATEVRESAIESLAENLNDSVVAPLFWFAVAGLPGAALYRFANTADAMWGYRGWRRDVNGWSHWEWAGKWAARADDVLSWLPARLTALLLALVASPRGLGWLVRLPAEAARTPSPNSGWPMAALALALGLRLGKPGCYVLHAAGRAPAAADTAQALALARNVVLALAVPCLVALLFIAWWWA